jgi:hypothetical protein
MSCGEEMFQFLSVLWNWSGYFDLVEEVCNLQEMVSVTLKE